jgi:hypothetical protein
MGAPSPQQLAKMFGVDLNIVRQAEMMYPSVGETGKMMDYIAAHADAQTKQRYEMEKMGVGQR